MFNFSSFPIAKKILSLTIAILFTFNTISWAAPVEQDTLRAVSTGQRDSAEEFEPLHRQALSALSAMGVPALVDVSQSQVAEEIQQALAKAIAPLGTDEILKIAGKSTYVRVLSILSKLKPGEGLREGDVIYRLTKGGRVIIQFKVPGTDYVRVYSLDERGVLIKTDQYGQPVMFTAPPTNLEEAVRDFLKSRTRQQTKSGPKPSSAGTTEVIGDVVTISNELDVAVNKGIAHDSLLKNLKWWYEATGKRKETITAEGVHSVAKIMKSKRLILALDIEKNAVLVLIRVVDPRPQVNNSIAGTVINRRHKNVQARPVIEINDEAKLRKILDNAGLKNDQRTALDEFIEQTKAAAKPSPAAEVIMVEDLTFKVSSEKLEGMKKASPEFAKDITNLIDAIQRPKPLTERVAEIEEKREGNKTDAADIRLLYLLRSLLKVAVFGEIYVALAKDTITKKEVPLLIRKERDSYKTAVILDMLPTDVMRIINKLSEGGPKKVKDFIDGRPTRPTHPLPTRLTSWSGFYFQLKNSGVEPSRIGVASLSNRFSYNLPIPRKFKIGDIPATMNDITSFSRQGECYKSIDFNEFNLIEDYWLRLEDMFTPEAIKELDQIHRKLRSYRYREEIRNLNIDLMERIAKNRPKYKSITPSITIFNIFFKRKDGTRYYTQAEIVLAVNRENRLVPVLIGVEDYTLPESIKAEPDITGPTLMAHLSEEAINGILQALPKDSIGHAVYRAYATQQGATSKSSSAGKAKDGDTVQIHGKQLVDAFGQLLSPHIKRRAPQIGREAKPTYTGRVLWRNAKTLRRISQSA